jgi:hypothetical protein
MTDSIAPNEWGVARMVTGTESSSATTGDQRPDLVALRVALEKQGEALHDKQLSMGSKLLECMILNSCAIDALSGLRRSYLQIPDHQSSVVPGDDGQRSGLST